MKEIQPFQKSQTSLYPAIIMVFALFVAALFTYDMFIEYQTKSESYALAQDEQIKAGKVLEELDAVKAKTQAQKADIQKYIQEFREDVIYEKVFSTVGTDGKIASISISPGETLTSGLSLSSIQFSMDVDNISNLLSFLDRATSENAPQRFLVKSLGFAYSSSATTNLSAVITLGMYTIK